MQVTQSQIVILDKQFRHGTLDSIYSVSLNVNVAPHI